MEANLSEQFAAASSSVLQELDRAAIQDRGVPSIRLMEAAASALAAEVMTQVPLKKTGRNRTQVTAVFTVGGGPVDPLTEELRQIAAGADREYRIAVFCGSGNNGGDGIAAARLLLQKGYQVRVFLAGSREKMTPDALAMEKKLQAAGGCVEDFHPDSDSPTAEDLKQRVWISGARCMVDALFGTGLKRPVTGVFLQCVRMMNQYGQRVPVIAADVPSGLSADTGEVLGEAVHAAATVTFTCPKQGFYLGQGPSCCGKIVTAEIGIPEDLVWEKTVKCRERTCILPGDASCRLPARPRDGHKGTFGRLMILAGSEGYTGAPLLASEAAVRSGAGLVFLGTPRSVYPVLAGRCREAMPFPLPERFEDLLEKTEGCDAAVIGPGLGRSPEAEQMVLRLLQELDIPVVLDADGINALAGHLDILDARKALTVLTPHDGEFARLTGTPLPVPDRIQTARSFARDHGCILVLKGHGTAVADPSGEVCIVAAGNPGMAKGGSGDVLSGILGSFLVQKPLLAEMQPAELVRKAAWCHAKTGDLCGEELGEYGMTPSDMISMLPRVLKGMSETPARQF